MSAALHNLNCTSSNATDCILVAVARILQQLEDANTKLQESNNAPDNSGLDKANFAFTFIIGVVAVFFAIITVFQGFLAAGPGRLKCNAFAIGSWARLSDHGFDKSELRLRSTAYTPIIDTDKLLDDFWFRVRNDTPEYRSNETLHKNVEFLAKSNTEYFPATWLAFLTACGLHHPAWWRSKPQTPNYLPSEFNATPAYSSVNNLINLLALCVHDSTFIQLTRDKTLDLPVVRALTDNTSSKLDIEFRQHQTLGTYGVILASEEALSRSSERLHHKMFRLTEAEAATLLYARGDIPRKEPLSTIAKYNQLDQYGKVQQSQKDFEMFNRVAETRWRPHVKQGYQQWPNLTWTFDFHVMLSAGNDGGLRLLTADLVQHAHLFPWDRRSGPEKSHETNDLEAGVMGLLLLSRFLMLRGEAPKQSDQGLGEEHAPSSEKTEFRKWSSDLPISSLFSKSYNVSDLLSPEHELLDCRDELTEIRNNIQKLDAFIDNSFDLETRFGRIKSLGCASAIIIAIINNRESPFIRSTTVVKEGEDRLSQSRYPDFKLRNPKGSLVHLTYKGRPILEWLSDLLPTEPDTPLFARPIYMLSTEERPPQIEQEVLEIAAINAEMVKIRELWEVDEQSRDFKKAEEDVQHPLDDLLIYRAILIAVYLKTGVVDNSTYLDTPAYNRMIPVL